jgi:hypothetical protein
MRVDYSGMEERCYDKVSKDGYHNAKGTITDADSDNLARIIQTLFEGRKGNSEYTHWETGTQRLSLYMNKQHFFDLARQSYKEHTTTDKKVETPYKFVETLPVWANELTSDSVDSVLRVMRAASKRVGAKWTQEFEAVMTGTNGDSSPQMWHFDGIRACLAAVGILPLPGIAGAEAVRGSTEFVRYDHKRLSDFATNKDKMNYLGTVWSRIRRVTVTTPEQFHLAKRQDEIEEVLTEGNEMVSWPTSRGDVSVFFTNHLHRGAASSGIGYAYFCAWEIPENEISNTHTDGLPVQCTNWKEVHQEHFKDEDEDDRLKAAAAATAAAAEVKSKLDAERKARWVQRSQLVFGGIH